MLTKKAKKTKPKAVVARPTTAKSQIRPLGDRVLVTTRTSDREQTASGIIIPETATKERPEEGLVVAVGVGRRLDNGQLVPVAVKAGDRVIFSKYGPDEVKFNGEDYLIVSEANILAIIG